MPPVNISVSIDDILETALHQNFVPVVDDRSIFIGIITRQTLLRALGSSLFAAFACRDAKFGKRLNAHLAGAIRNLFYRIAFLPFLLCFLCLLFREAGIFSARTRKMTLLSSFF